MHTSAPDSAESPLPSHPSQWERLLDEAVSIIQQASVRVTLPLDWSLGGGTALMIAIDHRESHDIDIFIDDPQWLPYLNPVTQEYDISIAPHGYRQNAHVIKIRYEVGEIDFICACPITDTPFDIQAIGEHKVRLETPAEIIAKKVNYRGSHFEPRDMFDMVALAESKGEDYTIDALCACDRQVCEQALQAALNMDSTYCRTRNERLLIREKYRHLIDDAQTISQSLLRKAIEAGSTAAV